ncbi:DUF1016 N-terminal domain-containing protein [Bacteroidota bacterium]
MNFDQLIKVFEKAHNYLQNHAVSTVNQSLTVRNWLFGHFIVEYEQNGEDRAKYGTELLKKLADRLSRKNIKGLSDRNLRNCRQFYLVYPNIYQVLSELALPESIWQSPTAKSHKGLINSGFDGVNPKLLLSTLSFTHIIELAREEDPIKRAFYEVQAVKGNWSVTELQRQMGSLLYERTGLSTNKEELMLDANKDAKQITPAGIMRDPYVFEFIGLESEKKVTERRLEEALIDHL